MTKAELYEKARSLPLLPGVYIIRDKKDVVIYVGKAKRLRTRVSQYFREGVPHDAKVTSMIAHAFAFDVIVTQSEFEALILECSQIKQYSPKYNILLKDDKGYSYIRVSNEPYPRITAVLQKGEDDADYIGPFISGFAVREMVETAQLAFRLPTCNKQFPRDFGKTRPCLNAHIGRCMALCTGKISREEYAESVAGAVHLIKQGKQEILKTLQKRMEEAAESLRFEKAARLRDQIRAIEKLSQGQKVVSNEEKEQDVIAFGAGAGAVCAAILCFRGGRLVEKREFLFHDTTDTAAVREEFLERYYLDEGEGETPYEKIPRVIALDALPENAEVLTRFFSEQRGIKVRLYAPQRGDGAALVRMAYTNAVDRLARESGRYQKENRVLDELAGLLGLQEIPHTIESYDISNWGDGSSVAGMIVFQDGRPHRQGYRRFRIKTVAGTDDYASMAEALSRRVAEYEQGGKGQFSVKPDLILLDGGKGQVSAVRAVVAGTAFEDVPLFGMVKDNHHRTRAIVSEQGEIAINRLRSVFTFVTSIQDEVHRFSITYQRTVQKGKSYAVTLKKIPGVGDATAKALMKAFGTVHKVGEQSAEQLAEVKGVSKKTAQAVYDWFHPST